MFRRLAGLVGGCLLAVACGAPTGLQHTDIPPLHGHQALFYQALVDQSSRRLYLADEGLRSIDVFDVSRSAPRYLTSVKVGHPPHGLAAATDLHKVFAGLDGGGVAVLESDPSAPGANSVLAVIQTTAKKNVDLVDYDPANHVLWAAASDDGILFKVDAVSNSVLGSLVLKPGLEQPRYDPVKKAVFVPNSDQNQLLEVDPDQLTVTQTWDLGVACQPAGMGLDAQDGVALLGCLDPASGYTLAWDLSAGREIRKMGDIGDADQVVYNEKAGLFMAAGQANGLTAIGFFDGSPVRFQSLRVTHADSRAVAYDEASKTVYTPDTKAGNEGLLSFPLPQVEASAPPLLVPFLYLLPILVVSVFVWHYGRRRARERRLAGRPIYS